MTGNCLGWCAYGYYTHDPFVLAANLPGLLLSLWLNTGATKLQFLEQCKETTPSPSRVLLPQERNLFGILLIWSVVLVYVGWCHPIFPPAPIVGVVVNLNLVFFYGAPLEAIHRVIASGSSNALHVPTLLMTCTNTTFWTLYGVAKLDPIIYLPNCIGLLLGIIQAILSCLYPRTEEVGEDFEQGLVEASEGDEEERHAQNLLT